MNNNIKEIQNKLKKIKISKIKGTERPKGSYTSRELAEALESNMTNVGILIRKLIKESKLKYVGRINVLNVAGDNYKSPAYTFVE